MRLMLFSVIAGFLSMSFAMRAEGAEKADFGPKRVLAFYYAWYTTKAFSGQDRHIESVDLEKKEIGNWRHFPASGPYDSLDPATIERHMRQMKESGIDGPIVSWWGRQRYDDAALPLILESAARHGLVVSAYYETTPGDPPANETAAASLAYIVKTYADHPAWLRVQDRPVIFIYSRAVNQIQPATRWTAIREMVKSQTGVEPFLIGDGMSDNVAAVFDGVHQYNTAGQQRGLSGPDETRRAVTEIALASEMTARRYGRLACYTIIPGYDDTKNRTPGLCIPRQDGLTYELAWRAGIGRDLDWALITSFNEWHEGSEIEPSVEQGDAYLKATAEWAAKFKDTKAVAEQLAAGPGWQEIQARWPKGKTIAVIGPPKGLGLDLAISGLPVRFCGLAEFGRGAVSASECPIAVYTDGELFQNDCGDGRTVEGALRDYWKDGGWIVFASWRPWPLYKNLDTDENNWSRHIGLLLTNADQGEGRRGFSVPPEESLTIRASEGEWEAPYPASGDLRFRPSFAPADGGDCLYRSFAAVIGASGSNYGDAFSAYRYESGPLAPARMVYAFQGLWTALEPEKASLLVMRQAMDLAFDKEK